MQTSINKYTSINKLDNEFWLLRISVKVQRQLKNVQMLGLFTLPLEYQN